MRHPVKWGVGSAPRRASDRKGRSRVGGLSGGTQWRQSNGKRGWVPSVAQTYANVVQTCRVRSVLYTTGRAFPRIAAWRADVRTRNRAAQDLGGFAALAGAGCRLLGHWAGVTPVLPFLAWGGHCSRPGLGQRNVGPVCGNVRLLGGRWPLDRGTGLGVGGFLLLCRFGQESKLAKGWRWGRILPPDGGR